MFKFVRITHGQRKYSPRFYIPFLYYFICNQVTDGKLVIKMMNVSGGEGGCGRLGGRQQLVSGA